MPTAPARNSPRLESATRNMRRSPASHSRTATPTSPASASWQCCRSRSSCRGQGIGYVSFRGRPPLFATSQGVADFSDVLSISQFQYDTIVNTLLAQNKPVSANGITVALSYEVHASFTASPTDPSSLPAGGLAEGSADISLSNALGSTSEGGGAQLSLGVNTNTLTGKVFTVSGLLSPSNPLTIFVGIGVDGTAVGENGVAASYDANLTDTAVFLGVSFFADAAETIPLPDIQLRSALGLDYIPADAIIGPAQSVPEPGTWALMAIGMGGVASLRLLRKRPRLGNTAGAILARRGLVHALSPMIANRGRNRGIAQPGSAEVLGTSGRRFKSCCPDHLHHFIARKEAGNSARAGIL